MAPDGAGLLSRRWLLQRGGVLVAALAAGCRGIVVKDLEELAAEYPAEATRVALESPPTPTARTSAPPPSARSFGFETDIRLTATDDFYRVQYGAIPTAGDVAGWRLEVTGMVERELSLGLEDLADLPAQRIMRTLECISNPAGGDLIGNAVWDGVRLADVLAMARPEPGATELKLESLDGYHTGVDLALAADPESFLVFSLNGEPLPLDHGYPVRCLFPGRYGQKQPKWLTRITLQTERHEGHWEGQGWSDEAPVKINSRVDVPASGATVASPVAVGGIAFSGVEGVADVEALIDDVAAGQAELLRAPEPFARTVWTEWSWSGPIESGGHSASARATDGSGAVQRRAREALLEGTKPDGTSEMHRLRFTVP